jgi:drug/metabolite transporter (DMT)-like permease
MLKSFVLLHGNIGFHLMALFVVVVWGTTYVLTKVLIEAGLTPAEILFCRFIVAYFCIWFVSPHQLLSENWRDELLMVALGLSGGSLYFFTENTSLGITLASNVSLILCIVPLITAILVRVFFGKKVLTKSFTAGALIALVGVFFVVFNGHFVLKLNPLGDLLALLASLLWAIYCVLLRMVSDKYSTIFITRKVFFYGIVTLLPYFYFHPMTMTAGLLMRPVVWGNLLFLSIVGLLICFLMWNKVVQRLGAVVSANYLYIQPLVTLVTAAIVIHEHITLIAILGGIFILSGVYVAQRK